MSDNKQRITMMTRREKAAGVSGGWGAPIPCAHIEKRLQNEACELAIAPIRSMLQNRVAFCRIEPKALEPSEVARQAAATIAVIDELIARIEFLHPDIEAEIEVTLTDGEDLPSMRAKTEGNLQILKEAIEAAHEQLMARPSRSGPKRTQWSRARDDVASCIQEHSLPRMGIKASKALAEDLLDLCGLPSCRRRQ